MSTLNKKTLALALAAGLGMAANASAYTLATNGNTTPVLVATTDISGASTVVGINEQFQIRLTGEDSILGRTSGFSIRIELSNGAQFAPGFDANDVVIGPAGNNPPLASTPAGSNWTASIAAGGAGQSFVTLSINPPSTTPVPGLIEGLLLHFNASATVIPAGGNGFELTNVTHLQTSGNFITARATFIDPVSGNNIANMFSRRIAGDTGDGFDAATGAIQVVRSGNPLVLGCDPTTALQPDETIDVGVTAAQGSKTYFSSTGEIGLADNGVFNAGSITAGIAPGFSFQYQASDNFVTTVSGNAFSAFDGANSMFLAADNTCSGTPLVTGVPNATQTAYTFTYTGTTLGANFVPATGFTAHLCFRVAPGNTQTIDASSVSVVTSHRRGTAPATVSTSCGLLPLVYNGSVVKVATFNPAANATAQSFLRVTNPSSTAGLVTIEAWDDAGVKAPNVTFNLAAGVSRQINSDVIEAGGAGLTGALGDGAGKWRFLVTGEFAGMRVQSLNRNNTDGTVTNLTDYDTGSEQKKTLFLGTLSTYEGSDPN